jgi:hypothetical protein
MDELIRFWFRTECRNRLRNAHGNAFQDIVADLMKLAHPKDVHWPKFDIVVRSFSQNQ